MWQPEIEAMGRDALRYLQEDRFRQVWAHIWDDAPVQRGLLRDAGAERGDAPSLDGISKLPFTDKKAFTEHYPFGLFAVPREKVIRLHSTSGTTNKPSMGGYTVSDMQNWKDLIARICAAAGVTGGDTAQVAFGYGMFTGGFGLHQGLEQMGVTILPMSSGQTEKQLMMMRDIGPTVLVSTPSYALYLSEAVREAGIKGEIKLRVGLFGGEGHTPEMAAKIEENLGITATSNYGLCELGGPGLSGECLERKGLHIAEDHYYCEIIDSETGEVLPEGETGELVVTSLTREALPLIRYRTKDITRLTYEPCACGRTHARMAPVIGRSDDMLIIRGVNVFPSQIESVLIRQEHIGPHYMLVVRREGVTDTLEVQVELVDGSVLESFPMLEQIQGSIREQIRNILGLTVKVTLVAPQSVERFMGKARRVKDERGK
ncbi:MAG: phenylacetate--CoA ligase [Oscillospiraceae bacterium]|jgi:phenylacetate-CoA ligase|nr:phenylacetate--CoA ligase [Oscillospiraceae bacterium]